MSCLQQSAYRASLYTIHNNRFDKAYYFNCAKMTFLFHTFSGYIYTVSQLCLKTNQQNKKENELIQYEINVSQRGSWYNVSCLLPFVVLTTSTNLNFKA